MNETRDRSQATVERLTSQGKIMIRSLFSQQPDILNDNFPSAKFVCIPIFFSSISSL